LNITKPPYYKNSKVMNSIYDTLDQEMIRLENEASLTENQFFVLLADKSLSGHEKDVGLSASNADTQSRRSNILSKLRGSGTTNISALKNIVASYEGGEIEVIEYVSEYAFAIKFVSKKGVPVNLDDIKKVVEDIKPAHLEVRYIFTYRLWQDVLGTIENWEAAQANSWEWMRSFEITFNLYITDDGLVYYRDTNDGNAYIAFMNGKPVARRLEE